MAAWLRHGSEHAAEEVDGLQNYVADRVMANSMM